MSVTDCPLHCLTQRQLSIFCQVGILYICMGVEIQVYNFSSWYAGSYLTHSGWPHLTPTCPVGTLPGWDTSIVCPINKRLIRLAVDQPHPYSVFQNRDMVVQHANDLSNQTLLPADMGGKGISRSLVPWGYVTSSFCVTKHCQIAFTTRSCSYVCVCVRVCVCVHVCYTEKVT